MLGETVGVDVGKDYCSGAYVLDSDGFVGGVDDDDSGCGNGSDGD